MAKTEEEFLAASEAAVTDENARKATILEMKTEREQAEADRLAARDAYATLIALRIETIENNTKRLEDGLMPIFPDEFNSTSNSTNTRRRRSAELLNSIFDLTRVKRDSNGTNTSEPEVVTPKTRPAPKPVMVDSCQAIDSIGVHPTGGGSVTNAVACECEVRASYRKNVKVTVDEVVTNKVEEPKSDDYTLLKPKIEQQVNYTKLKLKL